MREREREREREKFLTRNQLVEEPERVRRLESEIERRLRSALGDGAGEEAALTGLGGLFSECVCGKKTF